MITGFVVLVAARPTGGEGVKSGPIALATILVLCIVAYFLFKSMSKHLKKVRDEFPTDRTEPKATGGTGGTGGTDGTDRADQRPGEAGGASMQVDEPADESSPHTEVPPDSSP